jgi:Protease inhibitor Inh
MRTMRAARGVLAALVLAGCAGNPLGGTTPSAEATLDIDMSGRWIMAAPNAPTCGMNFTGGRGVLSGVVEPEGGCPGNFYMSRHWTLAKGTLTIDDQENQALAHLTYTDRRFEGQIAAGTPVTLSRPPAIQ